MKACVLLALLLPAVHAQRNICRLQDCSSTCIRDLTTLLPLLLDSTCDDGTATLYNFNCAAFDYDLAACAEGRAKEVKANEGGLARLLELINTNAISEEKDDLIKKYNALRLATAPKAGSYPLYNLLDLNVDETAREFITKLSKTSLKHNSETNVLHPHPTPSIAAALKLKATAVLDDVEILRRKQDELWMIPEGHSDKGKIMEIRKKLGTTESSKDKSKLIKEIHSIREGHKVEYYRAEAQARRVSSSSSSGVKGGRKAGRARGVEAAQARFRASKMGL